MQLTSPVQLHPSPVTSLPDEPEVIERRLLLRLGSKILTVLRHHWVMAKRALLVRATAGIALAAVVLMILRALTLSLSYYIVLNEYRTREECKQSSHESR